ncbi:MAG: hypothetical protein AAF682_11060 [Planctomycetota bacterium]
MTHTYKRRRKIVPGFQLKLVFLFLGFCTLALTAQTVLLAQSLTRVASGMPTGGEYLQQEVPGLLISVLLTSFVLLLPPIFAIGVLTTFRVAGPIHRFKMHLFEVAAGRDPGPCRIRKEDQLHELCALINAALDAARAGAPSADAAASAEEEEDADPARRAA